MVHINQLLSSLVGSHQWEMLGGDLRGERRRRVLGVELCPHPSNSLIEVLTSDISECDVFGNRT